MRACASTHREFLALKKVTLRLPSGRRIFADTNWAWSSGEQWAMVGPDGSGKALLVQALLGRVPLANGEIRGPLGDCAAARPGSSVEIALVSPEMQRQLALSETSFYQSRWHSGLTEGQRTVAHFLSQESVEDRNPFEINPHRGDPREFEGHRRQFVRWLGLSALQRRPIAHLSNGELRKTLLAHALLQRPRLLILNDAFAGLDAATRTRLMQVVNRLMRDNWPVLVVTHRIEDIPRRTTHLVLIDQHRVVALGPKASILPLWRRRGDPKRQSQPGFSRTQPPRPRRQRRLRLGEPLVELADVTIKGQGKRLLQHVTWTVRKGECWLVLGPNGAGKTTLLNLIQGDHPQAYAQEIFLFGRSTDSTQTLWQARQRLGWMSPELHQHYPPDWPLLEVVLSGFANSLGLHTAPSRTQRAAAWQQLRDFGLTGYARVAFGDLSFGQQRLALLARAVVKRPELLILDEPCQGLDARQRWIFLAAIDRAVAEADASLIFVTHQPDESPRCITQVLRLSGGRIRYCGPA